METVINYRRYKCRTCEHIYDEALGDPLLDIPPGTRFDDLPDSWFCSACGDPKDRFEDHGISKSRVQTSDDNPQPSNERVVIIGAGLAGWSIIEKLRINNSRINITLITSDNGDYYYKPNLSESISKGIVAENLIISKGLERAERMGISLSSNTKVMGLDRKNKQLHTTKGVFSYTKLVLATGANPKKAFQRKFQKHMHYLNDLEQYQLLANQLLGTKKKILVIGAGLIGCEIADDLIRANHSVSITDNSNRMLPTFLPEENASYIFNKYHEAGIELILESTINAIDKQDNGIFNVTFNTGQHTKCDLIISSIGLRPNIDFAIRAKLTAARGVAVDRQMRTSDADIYAIGDCAELDGTIYSFVESIIQQAKTAADSICGKNDSIFDLGNPTIKMKSITCPASIKIPTYSDSENYQIKTKVDDERGCLVEYFCGKKLVGYSACGEISKSYDYPASMHS